MLQPTAARLCLKREKSASYAAARTRNCVGPVPRAQLTAQPCRMHAVHPGQVVLHARESESGEEHTRWRMRRCRYCRWHRCRCQYRTRLIRVAIARLPLLAACRGWVCSPSAGTEATPPCHKIVDEHSVCYGIASSMEAKAPICRCRCCYCRGAAQQPWNESAKCSSLLLHHRPLEVNASTLQQGLQRAQTIRVVHND